MRLSGTLRRVGKGAALLAGAAAQALGACVTPVIVVHPRSGAFGQTAEALPPGEAEVGVSAGLFYESQSTGAATGVATPFGTSTAFNVVAAEADVAHALAEGIALNVHASAAGLQPGLRIALLQGDVAVAVQPEVAVGFSVTGTQGGSSGDSQNTLLVLLAGLKLLASTEAGLYGGVGYGFQFSQLVTGSGADARSSRTDAHNLSFALGFDLNLGALRLRPEIAAMVSPAGSFAVFDSAGAVTGTASIAPAWFFFPNVTLAVRTR
jgi:hypothetical protein